MPLNGKVAFITGVARGQGRAHAVTLAQSGVKIIGIDVADVPFSTVEYDGATRADMDETVRAVEEIGGEILVADADVRSAKQLDEVVANGIDRFGQIDFLCANAA